MKYLNFKQFLLTLHLLAFFTINVNDTGISVKKITNNIYVFSGKGCGANVGMIIGDKGILLIDAMNNRSSQKLLATIRTISKLPIKYVVNTHYHRDHTGGNSFFHKMGATIISHENTQYSTALHQVKFSTKMSLKIGNEKVKLYHVPSHTFDAIIIYLPVKNVLFMGDNFSNVEMTYTGAQGIKGRVKTLKKALSLTNDKTTIIPGHGTISNKDELTKLIYLKTLITKRVGNLYNNGVSKNDIAKDIEFMQTLKSFKTNTHIGYIDKPNITEIIETDFFIPYKVPNKLLKSYIGKYRFRDSSIIEIYIKNDRLFAREYGVFISELTPLSNSRFDLKGFPFLRGEEIIFKKNSLEEVIALTLHIKNKFIMTRSIQPGTRIKL